MLGSQNSTENPENVTFCCGALGNYEDASISLNEKMKIGKYVLYIEFDSRCGDKNDSFINNFTVHGYTDKEIKLYLLDMKKINSIKILINLMKSCAKMMSEPSPAQEGEDPKIQRFAAINDSKAGFGYTYFLNNSSDKQLHTIVTYSKLQGIQVKYFDGKKTENSYEMIIEPNKDAIIILKKTDKSSFLSENRKTKITKISSKEETKQKTPVQGHIVSPPKEVKKIMKSSKPEIKKLKPEVKKQGKTVKTNSAISAKTALDNLIDMYGDLNN